MTKIAVNVRLLRKGQMDGIGWFTYNTLKYIVNQNPLIEFHFLFDSGIEDEFMFAENIVPHNLFPPAKHAFLNIIWFEVSVKRLLNRINPDLFLSPDGIVCLGWKGRQYGVIHDINFFHNPQDLKWTNRKYYNYFFPKFAEKAVRIATVSEFSKRDLITNYQLDPNKIDVVYNGVNNYLRPVPAERKIEVKAAITGGQDYFIFIGTLQPRKNIIRLLEAFEQFKNETGALMKLVIAGKRLYKSDEMYQKRDQLVHKADVIFTGRIADNELNDMLGAALALTFVPTFEGFGIPVIEAMQCEVPVITSNKTCLPEIAGDAAVFADPFNTSDIKEAMVKIYSDSDLRIDLIRKGKERKSLFTWQKTSDLLWKPMMKSL